jgi:exo-beta-1,3-glucanase (GH17 family)
VRIYLTECCGLKNVGDVCRDNGVGMIVGLIIKAGGISSCA